MRPQIEADDLNREFDAVRALLGHRLNEKGRGRYMGPHEAYGIIAEELNKEFLDEMHADNIEGCVTEARDIAVAAILTAVSLELRLAGR